MRAASSKAPRTDAIGLLGAEGFAEYARLVGVAETPRNHDRKAILDTCKALAYVAA